MLFEPDEREIRKKKYIQRIKDRKVETLVEPLREKLDKLDRGEIEPEDLFRLAGYVAREGGKLSGDFKKRTDVILAGIAMDENLCMAAVGNIGVSVRKGRITDVFSDAIINPAGEGGRMNGMAGALIKDEGGSAIESEAVQKIGNGGLAVTGPGELTCKNIIHVNPREAGGSGYSASSIGNALSKALAEAEELELSTVAVPDMAESPEDIPAKELVKAVIDALRSHRGDFVERIILVSRSEETARMFVAELEKDEEE